MRNTAEPEPDPDAAAKVSDPLWVAIAEDKRCEHLRQGRLLGNSWVSEEESLRPFASEDGSQTQGNGSGGKPARSERPQTHPKAVLRPDGCSVSSRASLVVAEQETFDSSPRWSLLRSQSDLEASREYSNTPSSREQPEPEGPVQVPAGNGLIMW
eukprot:COSAG02_NODE_2503_length_8671_cov_20.133108_1_plen_154_part_10